MALKQTPKVKQLILMSDASFTAAGYAIMIEDNPQKNTNKAQNICPNILWLKNL